MMCLPDDPYEITSEDVHALRERLGLSWAEFAAEINVETTAVQNWKYRTVNPGWRAKERIHDRWSGDCPETGGGGEA